MNYTKLRKIKKLYFGYEDISRALDITLQSARVSASRFVKRGLLVRIKRNLYVLKDRWDLLGREERFVLANLIQVPSYVSLMTAMDYYGLTSQIQRDFIESISIYRTKEVKAEDIVFNYNKINKNLYFNFSKEKGFFIATPEKAFLDAFYLLSLKRYRFDLTSIDFNKLNKTKIKKLIKKFPKNTQMLWKRYGYFKKT